MSQNSEKQSAFWKNKPLRSAVVLLVIIVVSTAALEAAYMATKEIIARNQRTKLYQGILSVMGFESGLDGLDERFETRVVTRVFPQRDGKDFNVWIGKDDAGGIKGYAIRLRGGGFQGIVDVVVGLTPDLKKTTGMEVIDSGETPGLGDEMRMCYDPEDAHLCFKKWFYDGIETEPMVDFVKYKDPEHPNEYRAITGATYTTTTIRDFLNKALGIVRGLYAEGKLGL
ncbi:MAG TPA: FMN-binding protein [Candidatus Bipolaricaulota bacterium]